MDKTKKPLAYDAYQEMANAYAEKVDTKPHNAYYERPAMLSLFPDVQGKDVLDAGCGPGVYSEELIKRGARVVSVDASDRMLELARERVGGRAKLLQLDLSQPLPMFDDQCFDFVNAPLCLDYIGDWYTLFDEFYRILRPGGLVLYSGGHPSFDAEYFSTQNYFAVEQVSSTWKGFDKPIVVPTYRRSLEETLMPPIKAGFVLDNVHEPLPTDDFRKSDLRRYKKLMHRPCFICTRARKPIKADP